MGDGISSMYDDYDTYLYFCEKFGEEPIDNMYQGGIHTRYIKSKRRQETTLSFKEYSFKEELRRRQYDVEKYKEKLAEAEKALKDFTNAGSTKVS